VQVQPSIKREGFATVPGVTWADIGALDAVRDELSMAIVEPIRRPQRFVALGLTVRYGLKGGGGGDIKWSYGGEGAGGCAAVGPARLW
jgi:SpoVK/Ycf46/Vps4 family AAA+-type ATPase